MSDYLGREDARYFVGYKRIYCNNFSNGVKLNNVLKFTGQFPAISEGIKQVSLRDKLMTNSETGNL